jgi:hypothetical protein
MEEKWKPAGMPFLINRVHLYQSRLALCCHLGVGLGRMEWGLKHFGHRELRFVNLCPVSWLEEQSTEWISIPGICIGNPPDSISQTSISGMSLGICDSSLFSIDFFFFFGVTRV